MRFKKSWKAFTPDDAVGEDAGITITVGGELKGAWRDRTESTLSITIGAMDLADESSSSALAGWTERNGGTIGTFSMESSATGFKFTPARSESACSKSLLSSSSSFTSQALHVYPSGLTHITSPGLTSPYESS